MSRLLHVLALLSLLLFAAAPASAVMLRGEKTAVPDFFGSAFESASGDECPASNWTVRINDRLTRTEYAYLEGVPVRVPAEKQLRPSGKALNKHLQSIGLVPQSSTAA